MLMLSRIRAGGGREGLLPGCLPPAGILLRGGPLGGWFDYAICPAAYVPPAQLRGPLLPAPLPDCLTEWRPEEGRPMGLPGGRRAGLLEGPLCSLAACPTGWPLQEGQPIGLPGGRRAGLLHSLVEWPMAPAREGRHHGRPPRPPVRL